MGVVKCCLQASSIGEHCGLRGNLKSAFQPEGKCVHSVISSSTERFRANLGTTWQAVWPQLVIYLRSTLSILLSRQQESGLSGAHVISVYDAYLRSGLALVREESLACSPRDSCFSS